MTKKFDKKMKGKIKKSSSKELAKINKALKKEKADDRDIVDFLKRSARWRNGESTNGHRILR